MTRRFSICAAWLALGNAVVFCAEPVAPTVRDEGSSLKLTANSPLLLQDASATRSSNEEEASSLPLNDNDNWKFTLSPYLWMSSMRADIDAGPISAGVDKCFTDLVKQLKLGGSLRFEGLHRNWGFYLDGTYLNLGDDAEARIGRFRIRSLDVEADVVQAWLDFGGLYRFGEPGRAFDVMLGGRYMHMSTDLSIGPLNVDRSDDAVSPVVGGRIEYALSPKWLASVKADAGGFGVGSAELVWGITALVGYRWNDKLIFGFGYRYYDIEADDGLVDVDMQFHGPMVGFSFEF